MNFEKLRERLDSLEIGTQKTPLDLIRKISRVGVEFQDLSIVDQERVRKYASMEVPESELDFMAASACRKFSGEAQ